MSFSKSHVCTLFAVAEGDAARAGARRARRAGVRFSQSPGLAHVSRAWSLPDAYSPERSVSGPAVLGAPWWAGPSPVVAPGVRQAFCSAFL